jgi:hypothetical protein
MSITPSINIVGCVLASGAEPMAIEDCVEWARRFGAQVVSQDDRKAVFVQFEAAAAQVVLTGCRAARARKPPVLRFGYASAVRESVAGGPPRVGERSLAQATDLATAAQPGQVLLSSQLASLLQMAELEPHERLRSLRVPLADGRTASAFEVEPLRAAHGGEA